jgi:hypothetical protein
MDITFNNIKENSEFIFDYLTENYGDLKVEIEDDFCWFIQKEEFLDISKEPTNCTLASIYDSIEHLNNLKNKSDSNVPTAYSLKMLSLLLRYLSEKVAI